MAFDSNSIQLYSDGLWQAWMSNEMNQLTGDSKWGSVGLLGLLLALDYINKYRPQLGKAFGYNPTPRATTSVAPPLPKLSTSFNSSPSSNLGFSDAMNSFRDASEALKIDYNGKLMSSNNPTLQLLGMLNALSFMDEYSVDNFRAKIAESTGLETPTGPKLNSTLQGIASGAGAAAGMGVGIGLNALGSTIFGDSKAGQLATNAVSQVGSSVAGNAASTVASNLFEKGVGTFSNVGSNIGSMFSNAGSLTSLGAGIANIGLDVLDPRKKAKWENAVNIGLGAASMINPFIGLGALAFNGIGHAFGQKLTDFKADRDVLAKSNASYGGSVYNTTLAELMAGTGYTLWNNPNRRKDERKLGEGMRQYEGMKLVVNNAEEDRVLALANSPTLHIKKLLESAGGFNPIGYTSIGKNGLKFEDILRVKRIRNSMKLLIGGPVGDNEVKGTPVKTLKPKQKPVQPVQNPNAFLREGGTIPSQYKETFILKEVSIDDILPQFKEGGSFNVIPEGALHARKHNMDIDGITKKGIPVVSEEEGGELTLQAEIEREEIIFRLEVTKQLEDLKKKFESDEYTLKEKDQFAVEAGKLLTHEIINNTIDNTNNLL